jgi:hypothetical protein
VPGNKTALRGGTIADPRQERPWRTLNPWEEQARSLALP